MKKFIILIPFLLSSNLFSAQAASSPTEERTCIICYEEIEDPLFDPSRPTKRTHLTCPPNAKDLEQNHTNQFCLDCLELCLIKDKDKKCPYCQTPAGVIKIDKTKRETTGAPISVMDPNQRGGVPVLRFVFFGGSIAWNPYLFLKGKKETPYVGVSPFSQSLPALLFTRWTTIAQRAPEKIKRLKETFFSNSPLENKFLELLLNHKLTKKSQKALSQVSEDLRLIEKMRPFYQEAFINPIQKEIDKIRYLTLKKIEEEKERFQAALTRKKQELFMAAKQKIDTQEANGHIFSPEELKARQRILNLNLEEETQRTNQLFNQNRQALEENALKEIHQVINKKRFHTVRQRRFSEEEIKKFKGLQRIFTQYFAQERIQLVQDGISTTMYPIKAHSITKKRHLEDLGLKTLKEASEGVPKRIVTRFSCPQRINLEEY